MTFERLRKLEVSDRTAWFSIPEVTPGARLLLAPAGENNKPYYNALLKCMSRIDRSVAAVMKNGRLPPEILERYRDDDRTLFALYVVKGWEGVLGDDDLPVPFSEEMAKEFLKILPAWIFDKVRQYALAPSNFLPDDDDSAPADARGLAGNSVGGSSGISGMQGTAGPLK